MRGFLAVARREIVEKRFVLAAAAVASLVPFLAPLAPGIRSFPPDEARDAAAFFFSGSFVIVLSLLLGATTIGRDLVEQRLGFYFSKPIGSLSIAAGKIVASAALAFGAGLIVLIPTTIFGGGIRRVERIDVPLLNIGDMPLLKLSLVPVALAAILACVILALVALAHCCGVILRSRSAWLALDAVALATTAFLFLSAAGQLSLLQISLRGPRWSALVIVGLLLISSPALLVATAAQVSSGRIDLRRAHRTLSMTMWGGLVIIAGSFLGGSAWYVNPSPRELVWIESVFPAPAGNWIAVSGFARHRGFYMPEFLYNVATGTFRKLRSPSSWDAGAPIGFSRDGATVAWIEVSYSGDEPSFEIVTARLNGAISRERRLPLRERPRLFLSPDGARLAAFAGELLSVLELPSMRSVISVRLPTESEDAWQIGWSAARDEIRLVRRRYTGKPGPPWAVLATFKVDIPSRRLFQTGEIQVISGEPSVIVSPAGDRLIIQESNFGRLTVCDTSSGAALAVIARPPGSNIRARFLADGRILLAEAAEGRSRLQLLSANGAIENTIDLGATKRLILGGQPSERNVLVSLGGGEKEAWNKLDWKLVSVDLIDGRMRTVQKGLVPLFSGPIDAWRPGSTASKLYVDTNHGSLVEFDPLTGERRVILGGR